MSKGWVKVYRELLDKPAWLKSTPEQKVVLVTLLLMANHKCNKWQWQGRQFECRPGQMITSLNSIVERCGKGLSLMKVRTALKRFEKMGFLTNESTNTERLITICNWESYQFHDSEINSYDNKQPAETQQAGDKQLTTNKNVKNVKNEKKGASSSSSFKSFEDIDIESARGVNTRSMEGFLNAD